MVGLSTMAMANYSSQPAYVTKTTYAFNFKAVLSNGDVKTSWNKFVLPAWYSWTYMKVVRSQSNSAPVYPDDGYVMYDGNIGVNSWTHSDPSAWKNYYRVCAITVKNDTQQKVRRCSNVVTLNIWDTTNDENTDDTNEEDSNNDGSTSDTIDKYTKLYPVVDKLVTNFIAKLEAKYPGDPDSQKKILEALSTKISTLPWNNPLFDYLNEKLQEQIQVLNLSSLLNVN